MENEIVRLNVVGITYNPVENGMYALVLEDEDGLRRIPIIVGYAEAQSIECLLQKIKTPRPMTHELTSEILNCFEIKIESVIIKHLDNGIFTADITLRKGEDAHVLDARSSDAIALAMRAGAPIYTTKDLIEKCGIERDAFAPRNLHMVPRQSIPARQAIERVLNPGVTSYEKETEENLKRLMDKAVAEEDYEKAGEIKTEIDRRHNNDI